MLLPPKDVALLFRLHRSLMFFVNRRLGVLPESPANPDAYSSLSPSTRIKVHNALLKRMDLIQSFVEENPDSFSRAELDIVHSWQHLVHGKFIILRDLAKYTVFLSSEAPPVAYGVLELTQSFDELIGPNLPVMVETVLLPFRDHIVYDSTLHVYRISFGPGVRGTFNRDFKEAKERHGVVTALPMSDTSMPAKDPKTNPVAKQRSKHGASQSPDVDEFILDLRTAPREIQEIAFKKGLIPYIPTDCRRGEQAK